MTADEVAAFERCIAGGGVAIFPTDTLYGLACDPDSPSAIERLYRIKGRTPDKPAAVMFFGLEGALGALSGLGEATAAALRRLLPGPVAVVVAAPAGVFPLAVAGKGLGIRVPRLDGALAPLARADVAVLQTSANLAGGPDPRRLADIPDSVRGSVDVVLDGGELSGTPSTVVDLTAYERDGRWEVLREGALSRGQVAALLAESS